jgi:hypothetical protein
MFNATFQQFSPKVATDFDFATAPARPWKPIPCFIVSACHRNNKSSVVMIDISFRLRIADSEHCYTCWINHMVANQFSFSS